MAGPVKLNIKYNNVQHWTDEKAQGLAAHLTINNPDVILIASTSRRSHQTKIKIPGYNVHSTNKMDEMSAGVAIAIKKSIKYKILNNFQLDTIAAKIETSDGEIIIMTNYSPPRRNLLPTEDLLYAIRNNLPVIIAADINARHSLFGYSRPFNEKGRELNRMILRNKIQHLGPTFDTFFHRNGSSKPDIILANNKFYHNYQISPAGLGPTDHLTMDIQISARPLLIRCDPREHIKDTNWENFKQILQQDPLINIDGQSSQKIEEEIGNLYTSMQNAKKETTPIIHIRRLNNLKHSVKFKRLTKILDYYAEKLRTTGRTPYLNTVISRTQALLIDEGNAMKYLWWAEQIDKIEKATKDNKKFWKHIKFAKGDIRPRTPTLESTDEQGNTTSADSTQDKLTLFTNIWSQIWTIDPRVNNNFCRVTEEEVNQDLEDSREQLEEKTIIQLDSIRCENGELPFHNFDVRMAIKQLKDRAPGPSKLRKVHFSHLPDNIITNITHIINCSYATGKFPKQLKEANIVMAHKTGSDAKNPLNYRPISLLNILAKIYSKLMNNKLLDHLENNNILRESQYGFRKKRGTASLLSQLYERVARAKSHKKTLVTLVLRDVKKAFDKVWIKGLIFKLKKINTPLHLLRLIISYLNNRVAKIVLNGEQGREFRLETGVPQGDVLSPTLFLLLTNDYPLPTNEGNKKNFILQFADDITQIIITKFNGVINNNKKTIHNENVTEEIIKQNEYERKWKITTNMQKFVVIAIGNRKMPNIVINNTIIEYKLKAKLLGMKISYNNFFSAQVKGNVKNAKDALYKLYRFRNLKRTLKIRLYKSLVMPLLVYPAAPLNMCSDNQMYELQKVQNKGIRWIANEYYPIICNLEEKTNTYKIEPIKERIRRLAEGIWSKLEDLQTATFQETLDLEFLQPHGWFPSSYGRTFMDD